MRRAGRARWLVAALSWALVLVAVAPAPSGAQDSDRLRGYFDIRGGESNPLVKADDHVGFSLGANLGLHLGAELSADFYDLPLNASGFGKIGEYGVGVIAPLVRFRYPLFGNRLVPYVLGGAGVAIGQFNDRKPRGFGLSVDADTSVPVGVVGGGIEYFVADNIAVGLEGRYIAAGDQSFEVQGTRQKQNISTGLFTLGLRMFYPELMPAPLAESDSSPPVRFYFGVKAGGAVLTDSQIFPGTGTTPEPAAYGGTINQMFGVAGGVNWGRYFGVELSLEGFETNLTLSGLPAIGEYAVYAAIPQFRLRYPLMDGKLQPYVLGGVGVGYAEFNDAKPPSANVRVTGTDNYTLAASLGAGVDYFVMRNIAVALETKFLTVRDQSIAFNDGPTQKGNINAFLFSLGLRVFLGQL
jgi:opacity protein-like surface antigen